MGRVIFILLGLVSIGVALSTLLTGSAGQNPTMVVSTTLFIAIVLAMLWPMVRPRRRKPNGRPQSGDTEITIPSGVRGGPEPARRLADASFTAASLPDARDVLRSIPTEFPEPPATPSQNRPRGRRLRIDSTVLLEIGVGLAFVMAGSQLVQSSLARFPDPPPILQLAGPILALTLCAIAVALVSLRANLLTWMSAGLVIGTTVVFFLPAKANEIFAGGFSAINLRPEDVVSGFVATFAGALAISQGWLRARGHRIIPSD